MRCVLMVTRNVCFDTAGVGAGLKSLVISFSSCVWGLMEGWKGITEKNSVSRVSMN